MNIEERGIEKALTSNPVFSKFSRQEITRLIPYVEPIHLTPGEVLFDQSTEPDCFYILRNGKVILDDGDKISDFTSGFLGEEAIVGATEYGRRAKAAEAVEAYKIPATAVETIFTDISQLKSDLFFSLLNKSGKKSLKQRVKKVAPETMNKNLFMSIGWILTIIAPVLSYKLLQAVPIVEETRIFLSILAATFLMWIFRITTDFVPGIFAVIAALVMGLAPAKTSLSGFTSSGFIMALSVFSLGSIIISSGLTFRLLLYILRWVPANHFLYNISSLFTGYALTPIVPTITGRTALVAPLAADFVKSAKLNPFGLGATRISVGIFVGATLFAPVFLSSSPVNFLVLSLLPLQDQLQFHWLGWFNASLVYAGVTTFLYIIASTLYFWKAEPPIVSRERVKDQLKFLGPVTHGEWVAIAGFVIFTAGILTFETHKIPIAWIGLIVLFILMAFGIFDKDDFRTKIDWPTLMVLVGVVGIANTMAYLDINQLLERNLAWMSGFLKTNIYIFFTILFAIITVFRFFVPAIIANVIAIAVFMPLATVGDINPWVIAFAILALGDIWFFPYQCFHFIPYRSLNKKAPFYDVKELVNFNLIVNIIKIIGLFACVPYWERLGLL